ncbi:hypothetical protein CspHIS471_0202580 [Cutaneotrichosporon sp. HIS471]|nr:hypothetical protein CspHIS471_0202580 [Cutaneotrichosporon sp. HIS471]
MRILTPLAALRIAHPSIAHSTIIAPPSTRAFSSTPARGKGIEPRQLPVLNAFCDYLEGRDLSGFSHRTAVFRDFMETAPPDIKDLSVYVRAPSDLFYLYKSQLSTRFPDFWNMRQTPLTRLQPKRKGMLSGHLPIDMEILRAYLTFLRNFNWDRPVNRAVLRQEFTQSIAPGSMSLFGLPRGTVVLVTGGARGIGKMIATGFIQNGARVYISSRTSTTCDATAAELNALGPGHCISLPADLSDYTEYMLTASLENSVEEIAEGVPLRRLGQAEDIAGTCIYLASRAGAWTTGAIIPIDGGSMAVPQGVL